MNLTRYQRSKSYFYNMRRFHNQIKRDLYNKYTKKNDSILELAVGKAGDLNKWIDNKVKNVIGYDIDETSINEGKRRISEIKNQDINIDLHVKDLSRNIIDGKNDKDVIVSMFAFHYFFESNETFNTIMTSIMKNIKEDGIFMGTMFDGKNINNILNNGKFELNDNEITRFKIESFDNHYGEFGNKISVFIKDTVLDVPMMEYVVNFDEFVIRMKDYGFELIETKMFKDYYSSNLKLNNIEKQISFLNRTFVFKKIKNKVCKNETNYLMECNWSKEIYKNMILYNYLKAIDKQIEKTPEKTQLYLIKDEFTNNKKLSSKLTGGAKKWYINVYKMYLTELNQLSDS